MLIRRTVQLAVLTGVPLVSYKVYAAENGQAADKNKNMVKISELPLYGNPAENVEYKYVEEEIGTFRQNVSVWRQQVWKYMDSVSDTTERLKQKYDTGKAHSMEAIYYIQSNPGILPQAGVITVAGLGGIVAGYRGGFLRKLTFSSVSMLAAASLCYPKAAVQVGNMVYDEAQVYGTDAWHSLRNTVKKTPGNPGAVVSAPSEETKTAEEDYGQSNPEDKDLYTTRGS